MPRPFRDFLAHLSDNAADYARFLGSEEAANEMMERAGLTSEQRAALRSREPKEVHAAYEAEREAAGEPAEMSPYGFIFMRPDGE
jgi:hypothetical protein